MTVQAEDSAEKNKPDEKDIERVTKLFNDYVHKESGPEMVVSPINGHIPSFKWEDIPALLEIAKKDNLMKGMPALMISSYMGSYCREGMIALWIIEGIRSQELSKQVEKQLTKQMQMNGAYFRLPLNPICIKEGMQLEECESSLEIHKTVLQAYNKWWEKVKSLPASQAACFYPLDLTDITWFGSPDRWAEEPLTIYDKIYPDGTAAKRTIRQLEKTEDSYEYEPVTILQEVFYSLKNPNQNPPYTLDMFEIKKIKLYFYDENGKVKETQEVLPAN